MKRFIFGILIIILFPLTCYAQVETERFITPNGTLWQVDQAGFQIAFYKGSVWFCDDSKCFELQNSYYINFLISSFKADSYLSGDYSLTHLTLKGRVITLFGYGVVDVEATGIRPYRSTLSKISDSIIIE